MQATILIKSCLLANVKRSKMTGVASLSFSLQPLNITVSHLVNRNQISTLHSLFASRNPFGSRPGPSRPNH